MADSKSKLALGQIIFTAVLTLMVSLVVGILLHHYTSKSPELVYETFEAACFAGEQQQIGIYSARIENIGDLEAEDVQIILELPYRFHVVRDIEIKPNMKSISYEKYKLTDEKGYEVKIPRLNPNENCYFSIYSELGTSEVQPFLEIQVRAKGITGNPKEKGNKLPWFRSIVIVLTFVILFASLITLIMSQKMVNLQKTLAILHELLEKQKIK